VTGVSQPRTLVLSVLAVVFAVVGSLATAIAPPPAGAVDLSQFNAGLIISDQVFYNSSSMTPAEIQTFLLDRGSGCRPAVGGPACLKDYAQTPGTRAPDARCPAGYQGGAAENAATIVWKVGQSCGINPQVLLVMLQKEQGLVTRAAPTQRSYDAAMGQGCPDTSACDLLYTGFFNQLYGAAAQLQRYRLSPSSYAQRPFMTNNIRFSPDASCGSSQVFIQNQATAGLYNYTPYQPNAAALAAGLGTGDACSAYGNRNFWNYFNTWFGPSAGSNRMPVGSVDSAVFTAPGVISVSGWTFDPDTPAASIPADVYVDGVGVRWQADQSRPDVAAAYPGKGDRHGFSGSVAVSPGVHQVCVFGIDSVAGPNTLIRCVRVG
jgi:hypothetical protein